MQKSYSESAQIIYLTYLFETQQKPCSFSVFFEQIEAEYGKDFCSPDMRNRVETLVRLRKETLADLQAAATKWEVTDPLVLIILRHAALQLKENPSNLGKILNEELTICKQFKISIHFIFALLIRYGKSQELVDGVSPLKTFFQERLEYEKKEGLIVKKAPIKPPFPLSGGKKIPETFSTGPEELDEAGESSIYSSKPRTRFKDRVLYLLNNSDHTTRSWSITTLLILYAQKASALPEALATVNQKFNQNITPDSIEYQRALVFFKRQKVVLDNCNRFFTPSPKFSQKQLLRHNTLMQVGLYTQIFEPQIRLTNICFIAKRLFGIRSIPIFFSVLKNFQESSAGTVAEEHDVPPEQIL